MKITRPVMGMPITVEVIGHKAGRLIDKVFAYFEHIDATFSTYKQRSQISMINKGELDRANCSEEVQEVLMACDAFRERTDGYFDITKPNGSIDPSGLVKGWGIWNAAKILDAGGATNYFIEAGGDTQIRGRNSRGELWQVGIRHPSEPGKFATVLQLTDCAVATSGLYERGHHIYNPLTGENVEDLLSLTVLGPNIYEADVLATAAFAMGRRGIQFIFDQGLEAMMITSDSQVVTTPGFKAYGSENRSV